MNIDISSKWLPIYEALASDVRLKIIRLLSQKSMHIKELATALGLSSAIMTMHIRKLENSGIIRTQMIRLGGATKKICTLVMEEIHIEFPRQASTAIRYHECLIPVGHYTDFSVQPTCGLATQSKVIGHFDDPRHFLDPERVNARLLWFGQGYVEYKVPNYILSSQVPVELQISLEIGSEAPGSNDCWPSDISFFMNGVYIGQWTSPGDYGEQRGKYTPSWWRLQLNQFGLLKIVRINNQGTFLNGEKISDITLRDVDIRQKQWQFRISVQEDATHVGGLTLYGKGFGNYDQDIEFKLFYTE